MFLSFEYFRQHTILPTWLPLPSSMVLRSFLARCGWGWRVGVYISLEKNGKNIYSCPCHMYFSRMIYTPATISLATSSMVLRSFLARYCVGGGGVAWVDLTNFYLFSFWSQWHHHNTVLSILTFGFLTSMKNIKFLSSTLYGWRMQLLAFFVITVKDIFIQ